MGARVRAQGKRDELPPGLSKTSGCRKDQSLHGLLWRTMEDLFGRDLVPVVSMPGSSLWAWRSKGGLLRGEMGLALMESARDAGTAHGIWPRWLEEP